MKTKKFLALVLALVMAFSLVVPASANTSGTIPTEPATLAEETVQSDDTARMTVFVKKDEKTSVAAVGAIKNNMDATLKLNYGSYAADSEVTVYGQTKNHANLTTFSLGGTKDDAGIVFKHDTVGVYFPGLDNLTENNPYLVRFVNAMGATSQEWNYTFQKSADDTDADGNGVTLSLQNQSEDANDLWQELKGEAFIESHKNPENSFINLIAGSYLQMDDEKLTVKNDLLLDNFSNSENVNKNIERAQANLTYTSLDSNSSKNVYQLLLKEGTQFSLGASIAEVKQDLLVTMTGVSNNYGGKNILKAVHDNLDADNEENLAKSLLEVFSDIAGLVGSRKGANPVVITFGKPYTATNTTVDEQSGTTTDTSTTITVDTTQNGNETPTTTVNITTQVTVTEDDNAPTTTTTTQAVTVNTGTEAVISETVESIQSDAVTDAKKAVTNSAESATFRAKLANDTGEASETKVLQTAAAANAIAKAAATVPSTDVANVTEAKVILKTELKAVTADSNNPQNVASVTYDITPVARLYNHETPVGNAVKLENSDIEDGQTFTFNIPVPSSMANAPKIKVTHKGENEEEIGSYVREGDETVGYYVTVTVSHFSEFILEPDNITSEGSCKLSASIALEDSIDIHFYVRGLAANTSKDNYRVVYSFNGGDSVTIPGTDWVETSTKGKYGFNVASCAAKQMNDTVIFKVFYNDQEIRSKEYSIREYCENMIAGEGTDSNLKNLCRATLVYGAAAQNHFGYKTENLANGTYSLENRSTDVPLQFKIASASKADGVSKVTGTLNTESRTEINLYVKTTSNSVEISSVTRNSIAVSNNKYSLSDAGDGRKLITIHGIAAPDLDDVYTVTIQTDGGYTTITYSGLAYCYNKQTSTDARDLSLAIYDYYRMAEIVFAASKQ